MAEQTLSSRAKRVNERYGHLRRFTNEYEVVGDIAFLRIAKVGSREAECVTQFDVEDLDQVRSRYWIFDSHAGYVRCYQSRGGVEKTSLHQFLVGSRTDHRDQDKLNNCKSNLRPASQSQNQANIGKRDKRNQTSRYKGVSFRVRGNSARWFARIRVNGQLIALGAYGTEEKAAHAYDAAALKHFGEFACLNFPRQSSATCT